jgi:hypothetical protein
LLVASICQPKSTDDNRCLTGDSPNHCATRLRLVIAKFNFVDQLLLRATRLGSSPGQTVSGDARCGGVAMLGYLLVMGFAAAVVLVLGLVALIRCRREDIPAICAPWPRGGTGKGMAV